MGQCGACGGTARSLQLNRLHGWCEVKQGETSDFLLTDSRSALVWACSEELSRYWTLCQLSFASVVRMSLLCGWEAPSQSDGEVGLTPLSSMCSTFMY